MKNICWLATGGTIASRSSENGLVPGFTAEEMLAMMPELKEYGQIDCLDIMQLDSTNLQPKDWQYIAKYIDDLYEKYDGFVITHGTDTLTWTCCALHYMLENLAKPVVVIGAQRTIEEQDTDAKANLNAAFKMASLDKIGVFAVCGGQIMEGLWAKKLYSEDLKSIQSVNKMPIATFNGYDITWNNYINPPINGDFKVHYDLELNVAQIKMMPGLNSKILDSLVDLGYKGIVIEAYGAGGIPFAEENSQNIIGAIERLTNRGIKIVCTTQCLYDGVHMDRYEVGIKAQQAGVIPAQNLSVEAATVKLMIELAK